MIDELLLPLPPQHRAALKWFADHQGQIVGWPGQLPDGTFLVNRPKGIHKPAGWRYALSVRQTLKGTYPDEEPVLRPDGSWSYRYYQEQMNPAERDAQFTNTALIACQRDRVPVGVLRQVSGKPNVRYEILGLALVSEWADGYFQLEGLPTNFTLGAVHPTLDKFSVGQFSSDQLVDARKRVLTSIVRRQGQGPFRDNILEAYGGRCAITDCDLSPALEAAHIIPYLGAMTNHVQNGLLLRADLHTLFDLHLISIDPDTYTILVGTEIGDSVYGALAGKRLRLPHDEMKRPSADALRQHRSAMKSPLLGLRQAEQTGRQTLSA